MIIGFFVEFPNDYARTPWAIEEIEMALNVLALAFYETPPLTDVKTLDEVECHFELK